jgi:hypothetical protein
MGNEGMARFWSLNWGFQIGPFARAKGLRDFNTGFHV